MRLAAWTFTLLVFVAVLFVFAFALLYPEARFGLLGLGPYPLWLWLVFALGLGALSVFVWLPALHLRAAAERRALLKRVRELEKALAECQKPEELPRIPDREPEA